MPASKSLDEIDNLKGKIEIFKKKYDNIDKKNENYVCQDLQRLKVGFKYADALAQEGYDFIATNKDLFYSDGKNYYNQDLNESRNNTVTSYVETVQLHYLSTVFAVKKIKGEAIEKENEDRYLKATYFSSNKLLGRSILQVEKLRSEFKAYQDKFEKMNCYKIMKEDF